MQDGHSFTSFVGNLFSDLLGENVGPFSANIGLFFVVKAFLDEPRAIAMLSMADVVGNDEGVASVSGGLKAKIVAVTGP